MPEKILMKHEEKLRGAPYSPKDPAFPLMIGPHRRAPLEYKHTKIDK